MGHPKDVIVHLKNYSTVTLECSSTISRELSQYFSVYAANYRFTPAYKAGWDGKIRFFSVSNNELAIGLTSKLEEFAKRGNYSLEFKYDRFNNIKREEFQKFVESLNIPFELRDYQFEAAYQAIVKKNLNIHISTRGGKTLVMYVIVRFMHHMNKKMLIVVPNQMLVTQAFADFKTYGWDSNKYCHQIYSGQEKIYDAPVIIACWQSMTSLKVKKDNPYEKFDCIFIDEAHSAGAKSLIKLSTYVINSEYRFGCSGTYPEQSIADWYSIVGSCGAIQTFATYKSLQEDGHIANLKIYSLLFNYNKEFKLKVYNECGSDYSAQNDMIHTNPDRNKFLCKLVQNLDKNCLCLFTKKEKHGIPMFEYFKEHLKDKLVLYIDGDVPIEERQDIVKIMEERNNVVLLGTYGCLSTGITIKNLHTIVFTSSYKSKTKVFQALGRSLGLNSNKSYAKLIDCVDDVSFIDRVNKIRFINHSINHYKERKQFYIEENWIAKEMKYNL